MDNIRIGQLISQPINLPIFFCPCPRPKYSRATARQADLWAAQSGCYGNKDSKKELKASSAHPTESSASIPQWMSRISEQFQK